jgi:hypothetical protein
MKTKRLSVRHIKIQLRFIDQGPYKYKRAELRLCGKWLEDYGFNPGKVAIITCDTNKLTIVVDPFLL